MHNKSHYKHNNTQNQKIYFKITLSQDIITTTPNQSNKLFDNENKNTPTNRTNYLNYS